MSPDDFAIFAEIFCDMWLFFIVLPIAYLAGNFYIFRKGKQALKTWPTGLKAIIAFLFWGSAFAFFGSFGLRNTELPTLLAQVITQLGTGWLVFALYMTLSLFTFDLLRVIHHPFKHSFGLSFALTISLLAYGNYRYQHPSIKVINRVINKSLKTYEPSLKVVAVSDIHLGYSTNKAMLKEYVEKINAQHPDVILIGGDLIDSTVKPLWEQRMQEELAQLKAPLGIYMVPGNHEYISDINASAEFIKQTPIVLLRDSIALLPNGIQIIGRDDRMNKKRKSLAALTVQLAKDKPSILLDHQPYDLGETVDAGIDLQFSGHTHRGQIWPISWIVDRLFEVSHGFKKEKNSMIYVSSGLSLWGPPFRIGTDSELVVFNITFNK